MKFSNWLKEANIQQYNQKQTASNLTNQAKNFATDVGTDVLGAVFPPVAVAKAGYKLAKMGFDYLTARKSGKAPTMRQMIGMPDGQGNPKFDINDSLFNMMSEPFKDELVKSIESAISRNGYTSDQQVPDNFGTAVALDLIDYKVKNLRQQLGISPQSTHKIVVHL